jgi:hypothetical protein
VRVRGWVGAGSERWGWRAAAGLDGERRQPGRACAARAESIVVVERIDVVVGVELGRELVVLVIDVLFVVVVLVVIGRFGLVVRQLGVERLVDVELGRLVQRLRRPRDERDLPCVLGQVVPGERLLRWLLLHPFDE